MTRTDEIRVFAKYGFPRVLIAKLTGVRYQIVNNALAYKPRPTNRRRRRRR